MQFLNPAVLVGLIAGLAPLAIHLLHRGRSRPFPFSNLAFLRQLHHSRMRRVQLRQWLVLLLRTLIILLIVAAFARPAYRAGSGWWVGASSPVTAVVLLDQSYSTTQRCAGGTAFAELRQRALQLLELFSERDQLTILPFAETPGEPLAGTGSSSELAQRLRSLEPSEAGTDVWAALQRANDLLMSAPSADRELFILGDMAAHGWPATLPGDWQLAANRVYLVTSGVPMETNLHIDGVRVADWMSAVGRKMDVVATLANTSQQPLSGVELDVYLDGERVRHESVALAAKSRKQVEMSVVPRRAGPLAGTVEIQDDVLSLDNRRYFVVDVPQAISVLILGDTPAASYYLHRALEAVARTDPVLSVRTELLSTLDAGLLDGVDILILANLRHLGRAQTIAVHEYMSSGGRVVIVPGRDADVSYFNRDLLPELLPVLMKGMVESGEGAFQQLDRARSDQPLGSDLLQDPKYEDIRFSVSYQLLPGAGLEPWLYFADGRLALVSGCRGRGRALLWATSTDLSSGELPLRGLFVPLWQRLVRELALPVDRHDHYRVGQPIQRRLPTVGTNLEVQAESPSGRTWLLEAETRHGQRYWRLPRITEAGIWYLRQQGSEVDRFAVNVDTSESLLRPVRLDSLTRLFGAQRLHVIQPGDDLRQEVLGKRYGRELWRELLVVVVLLSMIELWVARAPRSATNT